jgi:hypothetical protein
MISTLFIEYLGYLVRVERFDAGLEPFRPMLVSVKALSIAE